MCVYILYICGMLSKCWFPELPEMRNTMGARLVGELVFYIPVKCI